MSGAQRLCFAKLRDRLHRHRAVLVAVLVATSLVVTGFASAYKKVSIVADGNTLSLSTVYNNAEDVLAQAKIQMGPQDEFRVSTPRLISGAVIEVFRAVPVKVIYKDKTETVITGKPTAGELAASLGFASNDCRLNPPPDTRIAAGMAIQITRVAERIETRELVVPPPVVNQPDPGKEKGVEEVVQTGEEGLKTVTVKIRLEDGQDAGSQTVEEKVVKEPVPRIVSVGTRDTVNTSRGNMRFREVRWMEATAYNPTDGAPHGLTATGIPARRGIVAVDPDVIPLGTRVYVPGYGVALAADVGGAIVGDRIDLCMEGYDEAWAFGRRMVKVYVIAE